MDISDMFVNLVCEKIEKGRSGKKELFLFNQESNKGFLVYGIAVDICLRLDGKSTFHEVINQVSKEKSIDISKFKIEIDNFKTDLISFDLIKVSDRPF